MPQDLSLPALASVDHVSDVGENICSMLRGYTAFKMSDRAASIGIVGNGKAELYYKHITSLSSQALYTSVGLCCTPSIVSVFVAAFVDFHSGKCSTHSITMSFVVRLRV